MVNFGGYVVGRVEIILKSMVFGIISIVFELVIGFVDCGDGVCEVIFFKVFVSVVSLVRIIRVRCCIVEIVDYLLVSRIIFVIVIFVCIL